MMASTKQHKQTKRKWSARVTKTSNALDLEKGIFTKNDPMEIARSLKRSALRSRRRKGTPYQSAMSMLNFYINRAGKHLPETTLKTLEDSKGKLKEIFHKAAI